MVTATEKYQQMSGRISLPKEFVQNFALYEIELREEGFTANDIDEVKQEIRGAWQDEELRTCWINFVQERADKRRELIRMAQGITERIKARLAASRAQETLSEERKAA